MKSLSKAKAEDILQATLLFTLLEAACLPRLSPVCGCSRACVCVLVCVAFAHACMVCGASCGQEVCAKTRGGW